MKNHYVLLSKQAKLPRQPQLYDRIQCSKLWELLQKFNGPCALDFETSGLDPFAPNAYIRCISLASSEACIAIDLSSLSAPALNLLWDWAKGHSGFLIFNATFDAMWAQLHGKPIKIAGCVATLFRHTSTDGWAGQSWSLKTAETDILGWPETNTGDLYKWLAEHKYGKGDMHLAPWNILGKYAALDAEATLQLYDYLKEAINTKLPQDVASILWDYTNNDVLTEIHLLIEQQIEGMTINMEKLADYAKELEGHIDAELRAFLTHEKIAPILESLKQAKLDEMSSVVIEKFTKTGSIAKRWETHEQKKQELAAAPIDVVFNADSPKQLAWLFYDKLKYKVQRSTEKGEPSVDNKALPYFGEPGKILSNYRKLRDKLKFVTATQNVQRNGTLHPSMTMSGTATGRLAGGNKDE
jgi:DNA polymerase I-like protein with 3'-5' exonuclease and polymerase domains